MSVFGEEVDPLLAVVVAEGLVRTRSAQDFGFGGEDTAAWLSSSPVSVFKLCVVSDGDVCSCALSGGSSFCEAMGCAFGGIGNFGVTGTTGTIGLVAVRVWEEEEAAREEEGGTAVDDGVGGCVESVSEGTSDVAGVSWSEGAATVELFELVRSSTALAVASVRNV